MPGILDILRLLEGVRGIPDALGYKEPDPGYRRRIGNALGMGRETWLPREEFPETATAAPSAAGISGRSDYIVPARNPYDAVAERYEGGGTFNQGKMTDTWREPIGGGAADQLLGNAWQAAISLNAGERGSSEKAKALASLLQGAAGVAQEGRIERELPLRTADTESLIQHRQAQNKRWDDESLNDRFLRYMDLRRNRGFMDPEPPSFDKFEAEYSNATRKVAPDVEEIQTKDNPLLPRQKEGTVVTETAQEAGQRNLRPTIPISVDGKTYNGYFFEEADKSLTGKGKWKKLSNGWGFVPNSELGL